MSIFFWKTSPLLKTKCSHVFFSFFHKNLPALMHMIGKKSVNSVKTTLYYGPIKSIGCPFFPISHEKITALMSIFCQKRPFSKKNSSHVHILLKNVPFFKNNVLSCLFFIFFHKKPRTLMPIFGQKTYILSKLHYLMGHKSQ